jgi:hypothetical protein
MAGKPRNRLELRRQYEAAEPLDPVEDDGEEAATLDTDEVAPKPKKKAKAPAAPKKAKTVKAAKPAARMKVVWHVVNDAFKTIAVFEYGQREAAEAKAAEMTAKGKGSHFVQAVKEAMADDAPGLGAGIPRVSEAPTAASRPKPKAKAAAKVVEPEEEIDDEDDADDEDEDDMDEDDD